MFTHLFQDEKVTRDGKSPRFPQINSTITPPKVSAKMKAAKETYETLSQLVVKDKCQEVVDEY